MKPLVLDIKRLMRRQPGVSPEISESKHNLRHIKKTTDIYAEFTDAGAETEVMQERQIV